MEVKHVFLHPEHQNDPFGFHVAILETKQEMTFDDYTGAVVLPTIGIDINKITNRLPIAISYTLGEIAYTKKVNVHFWQDVN